MTLAFGHEVISTTRVSRWVHRSIRVDALIHPLTRVVLTSSGLSLPKGEGVRHLDMALRIIFRYLIVAHAARHR